MKGRDLSLSSQFKKEILKFFTNKFFWILLVIAFLGVFLRLERILRDLVIFTFDQGRDFLAVKKIVVERKPTLIGPFSGLQGFFYGPYWYYFLTIPFILFRGDPRGASFFLTLFFLISVFYCFYILKKRVHPIAGIIFAFFLSFSPQGLSASLVAGNPSPIFFLLPLTFYFLYKIIFLKPKLFDLFLLGFLASFLFNFQIAFAFFFPFVILISFLIFRKKVRISFGKISFFLLGFVLPFLPLIVFDLRHQFLISRSLLAFFQGENRSLYSKVSFDLSKKFWEIGHIFFGQAFDLFALKRKALFLLFLFCFLLSLKTIGFAKIIKEKLVFFSLSLVVYFLGFLFYPGPVWSWYVVGLPIFYLFLVSFVFSFPFQKNLFLPKLVIFIYLVSYLVFSVNPLERVKDLKRGDTQLAHLANYKKVIDYLYQDSKGEKFSVFVYTPPVYDYTWQYLFWWYGQKKYGYLPGKEKKGVFYLIIEPDWERPWGAKGWKETVIRVGKTLSQKQFPTGVIVEKRIY